MAVKSGSIIHDIHGFVADRLQTGGVSNLNIPEETIRELGNWKNVAKLYDTPDLSFDLESFDVSTELEALFTFVDPTSVVNGDAFSLDDAIPLDVISPFKNRVGEFTTPKGLIIPSLTLESSTYRFGTGTTNATQQHTLRGDSVFYVPGTPYYEEFSGDGSTGTFTLAHTAIVHNDGADAVFVPSLCVVFSDGSYRRLFFGEDYTNTSTTFTVLDPSDDAPAGSTLRACYGSATIATYPQVGLNPSGHTVHEGVSVKPGAVRGKDIDVYVGTNAATPVFSRWTSVQNFEIQRRITLDKDQEFGNAQYVGQDYDTPDVTGTLGVRPRDLQDLWDKIHQVTGVPDNEIVGTATSISVPIELRVSDPETGNRLKTFYIPDARFKVPAIQGRVGQKVEVSFEFGSDTGDLQIFKGNRAGT